MKAELGNYIHECEKYEEMEKLNDVYVTDHVPIEPKLNTMSEEEDQDFYDYHKSLDEYNSDAAPAFTPSKSSRYDRGSLMQRIMDPFAHATKDENGAILYHVSEKDMSHLDLDNEEVLKEEYERLKSKADVWDVDEEDEDAWRMALVEELESQTAPFKIEDFEAVLDKELAVFQKGDKYSYVKDLKDAYKVSMASSTESKIFSTIPDHVFWDIKTPQKPQILLKKNRYNPFRGAEFDNFFEMRESERYIKGQHQKENRNDAISIYKRY